MFPALNIHKTPTSTSTSSNFGQLRRKSSYTPSVVENSNFNFNFGQLRRKSSQTPSVVENSNFNFSFGQFRRKGQCTNTVVANFNFREYVNLSKQGRMTSTFP